MSRHVALAVAFLWCSGIAYASNDSYHFYVAKAIEKGTNFSEVPLAKEWQNYFNYTLVNRTADEEGARKLSSVMKIQTPAYTKQVESTTKSESTSASVAEVAETPKWVFYSLRDGLTNFKVQSETNQKCRAQSDLYELHLKNQTLWAVKMAESTQSVPIGLLGGTTFQMGNFEECIKIKAYNVRGKYCLANLRYSLLEPIAQKYEDMVSEFDFGETKDEQSVWEALVRLKKDPVRIDRQDLYIGMCMPDSCTPEDLELSLIETMIPLFYEQGMELNVTVDPVYCHTDDPLPFNKGFYITISFMAFWLFVVVIATLYDGYDFLRDQYSHKLEGWRNFVGIFSAWRNTYNLGIYEKKTQVKIVNGMKVVMMLLIIYGHTLLYLLPYPQWNPASLEVVYRRGADIALVNTNIVDVFFSISGFLTFYYGFKPMKLGGSVYLVLSVFFRYIRLFPLIALIMAYTAYVLPYTSDGPIWKEKVMIEAENCKKNWWLNLLLINNFIRVDEQCLIFSWYITTDMLLCIIASILMFVTAKKPKLGIGLTLTMLVGTGLLTFAVAYANSYSGLLKLYMPNLVDPRKMIDYKRLYVSVYSRAGPYLLGSLAAYLTIKLQERKYKFSKMLTFVVCVITITISEGSQYYGVLFYQFGRPYNRLENALYASLHRTLFVLAPLWFLLAYLTSGLGILDSVINHRMCTVLGRITYSVFLMNILGLLTFVASMRTPPFYSYKMIMLLVLGDVILTYVLGYLFYLYAEAPMCGLSKLMQQTLVRTFSAEIEKAKKKAVKTENEFSEKKEIKYGA